MSFKWPWQYEFPPFFTLQKTLATREKQLEAWSRLVLDYCQFHKIYTLDITDISTSPLFVNSALNRKLPSDGVRVVFDCLELKRHIDWLDKEKNHCHIYWRRPEEWATIIYDWAVSSGLLNTPCTLYEITQGDDAAQECKFFCFRKLFLKMAKNTTEESVDVIQTKIEKVQSGFLSKKNCIDEGDIVVIYLSHEVSYMVEVKRGSVLNMRFGALRHDYLIGKCYGSRVSATAGYVYVIRPNAELWTRALPRRTQILYTPDCSLILTLLDIKPGSIICESGTGSGSLSHSIAMAIVPSGHLYTYDVDEDRVRQVELELNVRSKLRNIMARPVDQLCSSTISFENFVQLKIHGLSKIVTCTTRNVLEDGFCVENVCDAVFLDLPAPWKAIEHAKKALNSSCGGRIVSFSPCIEQVQRACDALRCAGFVEIETVELVPRKLKVCDLTMESLEDFDRNRLVEKKEKSGSEGLSLSSSKKRRLIDEVCGDQCNTHVHHSLFAKPDAQPTHTGYITSATLLPY